jgi:starch phosphorylase
VSGWAIEHREEGDSTSQDTNSLYDKLERVVIPLYYRHRDSFVEVMRYAIALNASFFNTQRMVTQYVAKAYFA